MRSRTLVLLVLLASAGLTACVTGATYVEKARPILTRGSRLAVPGGMIHYRVVGVGPVAPLLLLKGAPGVPGSDREPMEALADERLVVRCDLLGAGRADAVADMAGSVQQLDSLRRYLGLERVHLYGGSHGATLALAYYQAHPRNVASLVVTGGADARPLLEQVRVPVLIVVGESDPVGPRLFAAQAGLAPGSRLVVVPGPGPGTPPDDAQANSELVREFLREVDGRH